MKKPIIEIKVNSWNKRTPTQQLWALWWLENFLFDLQKQYGRTGIADDFQSCSGFIKPSKKK